MKNTVEVGAALLRHVASQKSASFQKMYNIPGREKEVFPGLYTKRYSS